MYFLPKFQTELLNHLALELFRRQSHQTTFPLRIQK